MKKLILGVIALVCLAVSPASADKGVTPMLKMETTYNFMFFSEMVPAAPLPGRAAGMQWALAWEGAITGDVNGVIRWWIEFPPTFVGRWEIWDCDPAFPSDCDYDNHALLIMAGYDAFGYVSAVDWEGKGVVTYVGAAYPEYLEWFGRRITDGGYVDFILLGGEPVPFYGEGYFTIYNKPSQKH